MSSPSCRHKAAQMLCNAYFLHHDFRSTFVYPIRCREIHQPLLPHHTLPVYLQCHIGLPCELPLSGSLGIIHFSHEKDKPRQVRSASSSPTVPPTSTVHQGPETPPELFIGGFSVASLDATMVHWPVHPGGTRAVS